MLNPYTQAAHSHQRGVCTQYGIALNLTSHCGRLTHRTCFLNPLNFAHLKISAGRAVMNPEVPTPFLCTLVTFGLAAALLPISGKDKQTHLM